MLCVWGGGGCFCGCVCTCVWVCLCMHVCVCLMCVSSIESDAKLHDKSGHPIASK